MQISSIEQLKNAPISKESVISNAELATVLQILIGKPFHLSGAPRTDGSNLRKLISGLFVGKDIAVAEEGQYEIVPEKKKGWLSICSFLAFNIQMAKQSHVGTYAMSL